MTEASRGKDVYLAMGSAANNLTVLSGSGNGLANVRLKRTPSIRVVPGGGTGTRRQDMDMLDSELTGVIDKNSISKGVLGRKEGQRLYFEFGEDGNGTGEEKLSGSGFLASLEAPAAFDAAIQYSFQLDVDGDVAVGTF